MSHGKPSAIIGRKAGTEIAATIFVAAVDTAAAQSPQALSMYAIFQRVLADFFLLELP